MGTTRTTGDASRIGRARRRPRRRPPVRREARTRAARGARGPAPGGRKEPARCCERSGRGTRLSALSLDAAVRLDRRRRARLPERGQHREGSFEAAAFRGRSATRSGTRRVPRTPARGGCSRSACRSSSGRDSRARRQWSSSTRSSGTSLPGRPSRCRGHLPSPVCCSRSGRVVALTWWVRGDWPGVLAPVITVAPLAALWLWVSLQLPHRDAPWKALLPGALLVGIGFQVLHELVLYLPGAQAREVDVAVRQSRRDDDGHLLHLPACHARRHRTGSQQLAPPGAQPESRLTASSSGRSRPVAIPPRQARRPHRPSRS